MSVDSPTTSTSTPGSRTYAKTHDTRQRILAAALEEAADAGFHKTSLARIAVRAGVATGNLNYHFGSRRELLRELMGMLVGDLMARLDDAFTDTEADFFARQRAALLTYLEYLRRNPAHVRLADEIKLHEPELYARAVEAWVERMSRMIREGIAEGTLRPMSDAEITAQACFLLGARHFLEQMPNVAGEIGDTEAVDAYLSLIERGLMRAGARSTGR